MKIFSALLLVLPLVSLAQTTKRKSTDDGAFALQETVYKAAISRFDLDVATTALYQMMAIKPERNDLNDSLCNTYFRRGMFYQSNMLAEEILRKQPENLQILEIAAMSQEELGDYLESLNRFEYLYSKKKRLYILYKIASLQYYLKRIGECEQNISRIIADSSSLQEKVPIAYGSKAQFRQQVPVAAAALNIKGVILMEMNKKDEAKQFFEKSLEIMPDYEMAKNNLKYLAQPAPQKD